LAELADRLQAALTGRYTIERELGRGGMALVFLANDLKHNRPVAIKVLRREVAAALGTERFLREIQIAARLQHPNIVPLYDSGEAGGSLYYVMPFLVGESLRHRLEREGHLPLDDALRIAREVADALSYAHGRDVVHRDIKPENILLSGDHCLVVDFGIARAITDAGEKRQTNSGIAVGTPAYMSPEQADGASRIDGRADVYALGCVVYEMLAGGPPFSAPSARGVLARHALDAVPPLRTVRKAVPPQVERAVLKALEKAPADRFATAAQFAEALLARGPVAGEDIAEESVAVLPFANLSADPESEYFSDGITEEITNALAQLPGLRVAARTSAFAFRGKAIDLAEVGRTLKVATVLEGSVRRAGRHLRITAQLVKVADGYHLWSECYDRELTDVFAIQEEIARAIADRLQLTFDATGGRALVRPATANLDAYHLYLRGRYYWGQRGLGLKTALDCFSQALALDPDYALAHAGLADACTLLAEYGIVSPAVILPKARTALQRALELAPDLAEARCASGTVKLVFDWDWPQAARDLRRAVELNPRYAAARYRLALYCALIEGRFDEALAHARRAVELDPLAPLVAAQLGMVLIAAGRYQEAVAPLRRAIELGPAMLLPYLHLGATYLQLGLADQAIASLEVAAAASGRHPTTLGSLAVCFRSLGKAAEVEAIRDELTARARREYVQTSALAVAASAVGRMDEAFQLLDRACEERDGTLIYTRRYPSFELLRSDARMEGIFRRIGFPAQTVE
jgi:eukaryotic-like serine/threonine-protein kinase